MKRKLSAAAKQEIKRKVSVALIIFAGSLVVMTLGFPSHQFTTDVASTQAEGATE